MNTRFLRITLFALLLLVLPASMFAGVGVFISVGTPPPPLPVYVQPACPGDGYIWTPGYWAWGPDGYYWVPGTWVLAPEPGFLWTPGYWGWSERAYIWHPGYWGPHVGFYGGVNYGFGYFGVGFAGGYWRGGSFFYNRSVTNVNVTNVHITNVYNQTVINNNVTVNRVSYNGGAGGINARSRTEEEQAFRERRFDATHTQMQHEHGAGSNRAFLASVNHGRPAVAATARPGQFHGRDAVPDRAGGSSFRPDNRGMDNRGMNRNMPRPGNGGRNMDRPMPPQDALNNRGGQGPRHDNFNNHDRPENNAPRPDNWMESRGGSGPHDTAFHPGNGGPHESAPRGTEQGHGEQGGRGHDHGR